MTDFRMRLIIETILKDEKLLKTLKKDLEGIDTSAKKGSEGLGGLNTKLGAMKSAIVPALALVAGLGFALKKTFDLSQEGAEIIQLTSSFELFLEQAGVTVDLLGKLKDASHGTISEFALMSSTMTLVMGTTGELRESLLEATPQLMEMAKAANKLNPALGSTTFLYESLARGIKRSSPLILDNLGVVIKVGEAYATYANKLDKTIDSLTAVDKTHAILEAALISGEALIEQAGGTTDSYADTWSHLATNITDSKNAFLALLAEGILPLIGGFDKLLFGEKETTAAFESLNRAVLSGEITYEKYLERINQLAEATQKSGNVNSRYVMTQEEVNASVKEGSTLLTRGSTAFIAITEAEIAHEQALQAEIDRFKELGDVIANFENDEYLADLEATELAELAAADAAKELAEATQKANQAFEDARESFGKDPFAQVETDILSRLTGMIESQDFAAAGGQAVADFTTAVNTALFDEKITESQARTLWEALIVAATVVKLELEELNMAEAISSLIDSGVAIDPAEARQLIADAVPLEQLEEDLDAAALETIATIQQMQDEVVAGIPEAQTKLDDFLGHTAETASGVRASIAEEFGLAGKDVAKLGTEFDKVTTAAGKAKDEIVKIGTEILALEDVEVDINIYHHGSVSGGTEEGTGSGGSATGFNLTVPQGFPNDSYFLPLNVQSGEVITVTPEGIPPATTSTRGGDTFLNAPININSEANRTLEEMISDAIPTRNI